MATLKRFNTPAGITDLSDSPGKQRQLDALWNATLDWYTKTSIAGPDKTPLDDNRSFYFNPLTTDLAEAIVPPPVAWTAFPNRILLAFPNANKRVHFEYADTGPKGWHDEWGYKDGYQPSGPRGYQDEYCEWCVTRRASDGKIERVTFTCENPDYWSALWLIDPERVLFLYQELVSTMVQMADLEGKLDDTGKPSYNPRNKWNDNTTTGPAHLVSRPNTLGAEINLAAAATIVREHDGAIVKNQSQLIQCSGYGVEGRNSDPHIGGTVNAIVRPGGVKVTLKDPVGLYIQEPAFDQTWRLPDIAPASAHPSDYWKIIRGHRRTDPNEPDMILHATYGVPDDQGFCVGDIKIDNAPILFGSQIAAKMEIALAAMGVPTTDTQSPRQCIFEIATTEAAEVEPDPAHLASMKALMNQGAGRG